MLYLIRKKCLLFWSKINEMGLFSFFKLNSNIKNKFVNDDDFDKKIAKQIINTPLIMQELRKHNVSEDGELRLEYFFYTNTIDKAKTFLTELEKFNYEVKYRQSGNDKKLLIIKGWTNKMKMTDAIVLEWVKKLCEVGFKFDCDFDGWGTDPTQ
jgi:regulator of RNase E activity RraB